MTRLGGSPNIMTIGDISHELSTFSQMPLESGVSVRPFPHPPHIMTTFYHPEVTLLPNVEKLKYP